jgi:hypothetical protein
MSTPKKSSNQYLIALANASTTPAALQKQLAKLAIELDDAVYFQHPKSEIKAIQDEILDIQEAIASGVGDFEKTLRERHASYKPEKRSSGYTYGPEEAGFNHIKPSDPEDDPEEGWRAAIGYRPVAPRPEATSSQRSDLIKELEKRLKNLQFDLQDATKFREPKAVLDQLRAQIDATSKELEAARGIAKNPPRGPLPLGECFSYAYRFQKKFGGTIKHGIVRHPWDQMQFQHAWVELRGRVYDWQTEIMGREPLTVKGFKEVWKPVRVKKFTKLQAAKKLLTTKHYGPW